MSIKEDYWGMFLNIYCMVIYLSQLISIIILGLGFILLIVMWVVNKDKYEVIDIYGKVIINWLISLFIYFLICGILVFIFIGIIGFGILVLLNLIFVIVVVIKVNDGQVWVYLLSIKFLKQCYRMVRQKGQGLYE